MARKLSRTTDNRIALLRNLAGDLILNERIETTEAKAKELRPFVEKLITLGKRGDLHARKQVISQLSKKHAAEDDATPVEKLFGEIAERYEDRQGGYTRIVKVGPRRGDGAQMAIIELV